MYTDIVHIRIGQHTLAVVLDAIWGHTLTTVCLPACTADGGWWFGITFYGHIKPVAVIYIPSKHMTSRQRCLSVTIW